jgi:hypothetical protein
MGAVSTFGDLAAATLALVACRMRADEEEPAADPVELRIGDGEVPRFLRAGGREPYDRELLREDLKAARLAEPVDVVGLGAAPACALERAIAQAGFAGADVRTPDRPDHTRHACDVAADAGADARRWPARRLVTHSLALVAELRCERDASLRLRERDAAAMGDVAACRCTTDEHVTAFRRVVETYLDVLEDSRPILYAAARELGRLDVLRRAIDARRMGANETHGAFDAIADALLCYVHALQMQVAAGTPTRLPPRGLGPRAHSRDHEELRA